MDGAVIHGAAGLPPRAAEAGFRMTSVTEVTDRAALDDLLLNYYRVIYAKLGAVGVPHFQGPDELRASFWPNLEKFLPPTGRLILVHDGGGRLVGCGTLQKIGPEAAELKRLFVRPEASGFGLGRAIVAARMEAARALGYRRLLVNAIKGNTDMLRIYEPLGFRFIDRYPECADDIVFHPWFVYMEHRT